MRWPAIQIGLSTLALLVIAAAPPGGPQPGKKVYRDTIYRFSRKPAAAPATTPARTAAPAVQARPSVPQAGNPVQPLHINAPVKRFRVKKSENRLYVYFADTFKVFRISLGANPLGHKTRQGDNKTPEGTYHISFKNPKSRGYKSLKISYPSDEDRRNASRLGINPGGDIFIHGLWWPQQDPANHWKDNWTRGCIAVNNEEIEEIYRYTEVDTEITILP